ncbi:peptidoglycan-binding domain-containing protein [Streptomyces sp. NPDC005209]|uniref:peptidoglycan-binding domain-containing protein n=1 Tax=Streptomyces sp. NPDC005209 TaxID=3156715 RepID=UPI0033B63773
MEQLIRKPPAIRRVLAAAALAGTCFLGALGAADASAASSSAAHGCHWVNGLPTNVLRQGSTGACVTYLQSKLAVPADGIFGRQTHHAVIVTQEHCGLRTDGIVGARTWDALLHWCRE